MRSPAGATALLHADSRKTGIHELVWATPKGQVTTLEYHPYPRTVYMTNPEPLLFSLWELLQSKLPLALANKEPQTAEELAARCQARGICEALAILMEKFLPTSDDVLRAAVKYYKDNSYEVPGLAPYLWDGLHNADGSLRVKTSSAPAPRQRTAIKTSAPKPAKTKLSEADTAFIKAAKDMYSVEDFVSMYGVSASEVQALIS